MSYQVTVIGFDFTSSREFEGGSLKDALEEMGAKTISYGGLGSFIEEIGGAKYKQEAGGIYTWLLSKQTADGTASVDYGLDRLIPKEGDHIFAMYEFIPDSKPQVGSIYEAVELKLPDELALPEYEFTKSETYFEPETFSYDEFNKDKEEFPTIDIELFPQEDYAPQFDSYEIFDIKPEASAPALTPITLREKVGQKRQIVDTKTDFELENFLMDILVEARNLSVLAKLDVSSAPDSLILA